jgi:hypothetical protein
LIPTVPADVVERAFLVSPTLLKWAVRKAAPHLLSVLGLGVTLSTAITKGIELKTFLRPD